jgi:putative two-component system hydrogenase maturation factor HypX/HoxX
MDAGDIWASVNFEMRPVSKSSVYRTDVAQAAVQAILQTLDHVTNKQFVPLPLAQAQAQGKAPGSWRPYMKQDVRAIDWHHDSVATIVKKIRSADSQPGLLDAINGEEYYLYGAHPEETLTGTPGAIIAQRHGAICRAAIDGAVWISHLKQRHKSGYGFKLPAATVLGDQLQDIPEVPVPLHRFGTQQTFREIWYEEQNNVGYLHFEFYNGAMSTDQCNRLREAYLKACSRPTKVIVLMGGADFWSNGIHLNLIEAAANPAEESWRNINAMNDLVQAILTTMTHVTIAAMQGNAAAGGVMLALAADFVYARDGIVLNPHYKRMGLYGSEYWTYSLPKRVGHEKALELTNVCMPMGVNVAKEIGLIDGFMEDYYIRFQQQIVWIAETLAQPRCFREKIQLKRRNRRLDEQLKPLAEYRREELEQMKLNFYGADQSYHIARHNFVHKVPLLETPQHLAKHRQSPLVRHRNINCDIILPVNV